MNEKRCATTARSLTTRITALLDDLRRDPGQDATGAARHGLEQLAAGRVLAVCVNAIEYRGQPQLIELSLQDNKGDGHHWFIEPGDYEYLPLDGFRQHRIYPSTLLEQARPWPTVHHQCLEYLDGAAYDGVISDDPEGVVQALAVTAQRHGLAPASWPDIIPLPRLLTAVGVHSAGLSELRRCSHRSRTLLSSLEPFEPFEPGGPAGSS